MHGTHHYERRIRELTQIYRSIAEFIEMRQRACCRRHRMSRLAAETDRPAACAPQSHPKMSSTSTMSISRDRHTRYDNELIIHPHVAFIHRKRLTMRS